MFHGLSRRTLNALIIGCLLVITAINLSELNKEDTPLEPIKAAPLPDTGWRSWQTREGALGILQTTASDSVSIIIRSGDETLAELNLPVSDWASNLTSGLPEISDAQPAVTAIRGPLSEDELLQIAAYLSDHLTLEPPSAGYDSCQQQFPAAALWLNRQQGAEPFTLLNPVPTEAGLSWPDREQWQTFRSEELKTLRRQWLSDTGAIDIALDLAYHRAPDNYLERLYNDLATAQKSAPHNLVECLSGTVTAGHE